MRLRICNVGFFEGVGGDKKRSRSKYFKEKSITKEKFNLE